MLLAATSATAKTWVDQTCSKVLISTNDHFYLFEDGRLTSCDVQNWPISTPTAQMRCADSTAPKMTLVDDKSLVWDGAGMNAYDGPLPCGSDGQEWPD